MLNTGIWHFSSHLSPHTFGHSCSQPFFVLGHRSRQRTESCRAVEWHLFTQECPHVKRDEHLSEQPPSGAKRTKSSGTETSISVYLCRGQHNAKLGPMLFELSKTERTSAHIGTGFKVSELPIIYIPCFARLISTLIRLDVFKNPHFR